MQEMAAAGNDKRLRRDLPPESPFADGLLPEFRSGGRSSGWREPITRQREGLLRASSWRPAIEAGALSRLGAQADECPSAVLSGWPRRGHCSSEAIKCLYQ